MLQQPDRQKEHMCVCVCVCVCVQMENISEAIKFVNHGFHIMKTYSHIPGSFWMLVVYTLHVYIQYITSRNAPM
jgi:hypothetical protein